MRQRFSLLYRLGLLWRRSRNVSGSIPKYYLIWKRPHTKGDIFFTLLYSTRSDCRRQPFFNCLAWRLLYHQQ